MLLLARGVTWADQIVLVPPPTPIWIEGETMGTTYSIRTGGQKGEPSLKEVQTDIDSLLEQINAAMSTYRDDSEVTRFNKSGSTDWFSVSEETAHVVRRSLEIAEQSDGAFDPTVATLVALWHFDRDKGEPTLPTDEEIVARLAHVGWQKLEVRADPPAVKKSDPELSINLSAIAKGYAVDRVAQLLGEKGFSACMVEIGGEVVTRGSKADGTAWGIGIARPTPGNLDAQSVLELNDAALATSGNYRNFFTVDGVRYSHTIDPRTGRPVTHQLTSVSVLTDDCESADGYATALMVLGPDAGLKWANDQKIAAWMLVQKGDEISTHSSESFENDFAHRMTMLSVSAGVANDSNTFPWSTVLLAAGVFGIAMLGLGIGTMLSGRRLQGSCGGLAGMKDEKGHAMCQSCTTPPEQCDEFRKQVLSGASPKPEANGDQA